MNRDFLWYMDCDRIEIKIVQFEWNNDRNLTVGVQERVLILPEEIKAKRADYSNDSLRRQLAQNLMQQLWQDGYAAPDNIDTLKNAQISQVSNFYHNQILVFHWVGTRRVIINTEDRGVVYLEWE